MPFFCRVFTPHYDAEAVDAPRVLLYAMSRAAMACYSKDGDRRGAPRRVISPIALRKR